MTNTTATSLGERLEDLSRWDRLWTTDEIMALAGEAASVLLKEGNGSSCTDLSSRFIGETQAQHSAGGGEPWDSIPRNLRFGRQLTSDAVPHLRAGTLLRFYSSDPWFEPGEHMPSNGEIVMFTGKVSDQFPKVGPHLEVSTLDGAIYPGGGWVYRLFQFVSDPASTSPPPDRGRADLPRLEIAAAVRVMLTWSTYETEYDGRMYEICQSCGGQDGNHRAHCKIAEYQGLLSLIEKGGARS